MIVKLIQYLEIKMESQINSLETRIEKIQERFNKDLEEIKKSQYIMNNAINKIKNTLEATNSRITEAEDRISERREYVPGSCTHRPSHHGSRSHPKYLKPTARRQGPKVRLVTGMKS